MVTGAGLIGIYASGDSPSSGVAGTLACEDKVPAEQRSAIYRDSGVNPTHDKELDALPVYPGCVKVNDPVTNGAGSFAAFWATAGPTEAASFYLEELPPLGWEETGGPMTVVGTGGEPHTLLTFNKGVLSLTVDVYENPSKGGEYGNLSVLFRLQNIQ